MASDASCPQKAQPLFRNLTAEDPDPETTVIESLCMNCHENGSTRLLLTKIPFYKEVVIMSFSCESCGFKNNEIQSSGEMAEKGVRLTLVVKTPRDLNRQVVKSDYSAVKIVELDFEIPAQSQRGEVTTVEGIIDRSVAGLEQDQIIRRVAHPEDAKQIDSFITKLKNLKTLENPFTIILEDISGNAYIANPDAPMKDPNCTIQRFNRTIDNDHALGVFTHEEVGSNQKGSGIMQPTSADKFTLEDLQSEVLQFATNCTNCGSPCETNMKMTNIPHFKEVVIMATNCEVCGHRTNEVKSGGGIESLGIKIEVAVNSRDDFSRDVLKSETCCLSIPELNLEVGPTALGGRFTTVEGIITAMREQIECQGHMFRDTLETETENRMEKFLADFDDVIKSKRNVTLVLDDPAGNSYVQSLADNNLDEGLKISHYTRTFDQDEELGLNDMKTENYEKS